MFFPAILTGVLLWAAFFPLNWGPLAFVALVPWLTLVRTPASRRRRYFAAYVGGVAFYLPAIQWLRVAHPAMYASWIGLSLVLPVFWCVALFLLRRIDRLGVVPFALSVPIVWVALEYVRAHFPTGFPFLQHVGLYQMIGFGWYFLGYTQHAFVPLIQVADLGGVYAVSFLVAAVNGAVFEWVIRPEWVRRRFRHDPLSRPTFARLLPSTAFVAILFVGAVAYGLAKLDHPPFDNGPRVAAIQGSVSQGDKMMKGDNLGDTYYGLYTRAFEQSPRPDLIVWPETCCPFDWYQLGAGATPTDPTPEFREDASHSLGGLYRHHRGVPTLYGLNGLVWEGGRGWKYNSAVLLDPAARFLGRYDKMHLVPFGEYVPFKEALPFLSIFSPYDHDYSCRPGESWTRFPLNVGGTEYRFGCLICYEDSDPYLARQYVADGNKVDFLVNSSNDGWFRGTEEHEQHLAICRFRAVETRRAIVRSVNMGISCVVDPDGRVRDLPGDSWASSVKVEGVVSAVVPIDHRNSTYAALGEWVPAGCWLAIVTALVGPLVRRRSNTRTR